MKAHSSKNSPEEIIHTGKFIQFVKKGGWEYVRRSNCTGIVIIVPLTDDNHLIFVEQFRPPLGKMAIEFPAGLVNDHGHEHEESAVTAGKRELLEETGYQADSMDVFLDGPVSGGLSADYVTMCLARNIQKVAQGGGDEYESIVVHKVPLVDADTWLNEMKEKGYVIEPKIYAGLYYLKTYNS